MFILDLLILAAIAGSWVRLIRPGSRLVGAHVAVVQVPLLARLRMHAVPAFGILAAAVVLAVLDRASWWLVPVALGSAIALVATPVRYTLTDTGIRLGWTRFRRWTEFAGVRRARGGAILVGVQRMRGMHIWLSRSRGDDEFLQHLRQMVKGAYKGQAVVIPFPSPRAETSPEPEPAAASNDG